jgi:hypothetical protein
VDLGTSPRRVFLGNREIARLLLRFCVGSRHQGKGRVPLAQFAALVELSRPTVYKAMRGELSEKHRARLSAVLRAIRDGILTFERRGQWWQTVWHEPPDVLPSPQDKLMRESEWNKWARCRTCGGRSWNPVLRAGRQAWVACGSCIPEDQYRWRALTPRAN